MAKINKKTLIAPVVLLFLTLAQEVLAAANGFKTGTAPPGISSTDLGQIIINITNWILGFVTLSFIVLMIWGAVGYITAGGDEAGVEGGKNMIMYGVLGLMLTGISYAIVVVVVNVFIGGQF